MLLVKAGTSDEISRWQSNTLRPRFSVRTLVVLVTLVCLYFGCWEATKSKGVEDIETVVFSTIDHGVFRLDHDVPVPFLVRTRARSHPTDGKLIHSWHRDYIWFFGYVAKLPNELLVISGPWASPPQHPEKPPSWDIVPDYSHQHSLFVKPLLKDCIQLRLEKRSFLAILCMIIISD